MDHVAMPRMSLVAQYDDLCRYTKVLTEGCEEEFKIFVEGQLANLRNWKEAEKEINVLQKKVESLDTEKKRLETQLKHVRNLCEQETIKRKKVEEEKKSMERQIALIKEVLLADGNAIDNQTKEKLVFLSSTCKPMTNLETIAESTGSLLSLSYDRTEEEFENDSETSSDPHERRLSAKRLSSEKPVSAKKLKPQDNNLFDGIPYTNSVPPGNYRSSSGPVNNENVNIVKPAHKSDSGQFSSYTYELRKSTRGSMTGSTPSGRYSTGGKLSRMHVFCTKTVIRAEKCYPCGRLIKFCKQALKCQDCRLTCHPECKNQCPLPCVPTTYTPTQKNAGTIADYVSSIPPMIPSLIVHCLNEVESRGLMEVGLYRVSGSEREVKELKEKFLRSKNIPCLNQYDIHAICSTVKEFLRSLKEPLVTRSSWQAIVDAADVSNTSTSLNMLYEIVSELPQPNKDTLAFLILHLQRIAENPQCKMPTENLAKIFGPTVVGYSADDPSESKLWNETAHQAKVMHRLLSISSDYWQNLLNIEPDVFMDVHKTPEQIPAHSILGPMFGSSEKRKSMQLGKSQLTPRNSTLRPGKGKRFFSSPLLK